MGTQFLLLLCGLGVSKWLAFLSLFLDWTNRVKELFAGLIIWESVGTDILKVQLCPSHVTPGRVTEPLGTSGFSSVK